MLCCDMVKELSGKGRDGRKIDKLRVMKDEGEDLKRLWR